MDMSTVFKNDIKELYEKSFYYSRRFAKGDFNVIKPHTHQHYEIYYLTEGSRRYFVKNRFYLVTAGDFLIVRPNTVHYTTSYCSDRHERILLNFTKEYLPPDSERYIDVLCDRVCVSMSDGKEIGEIFKKIAEEYKKSDKFSCMAQRGLLAELLVCVLRNEGEEKSEERAMRGRETYIDRFLIYLAEHLSDNISLDFAADFTGFSKSHFSKIFKETTGFAFGNYLQMQRLFKARRLLEKTRDSVAEIAYECGFSTGGYFSTVFKNYFSMSPLDYRQNRAEKQEISHAKRSGLTD